MSNAGVSSAKQNQSPERQISLHDPEQRDIIREYFIGQLQPEYYEYFDADDQMNKQFAQYLSNPNDQAAKAMVAEINRIYYLNMKEESKDQLNIYFDSDINNKSDKPNDIPAVQFPLPKDTTPTLEQIKDAMKVMKLARTKAETFLVNDNLKAKGLVTAVLTSRLPVHTLIERVGDKPYKSLPKQERDIFDALMKHADLNQKNPDGLTPLQIAAKQGNKELVNRLLDAGANPKVTTVNYMRGPVTRIGDAFKGLFKGDFMKNWNNPVPRTAAEIADISGDKALFKLLSEAEKKYVAPPEKKSTKLETTVVQQQSAETLVAPKQTVAEQLGLNLEEVRLAGENLAKMQSAPVTPLQPVVQDSQLLDRQPSLRLSVSTQPTETFAQSWRNHLASLPQSTDVKDIRALKRINELLNNDFKDMNPTNKVEMLNLARELDSMRFLVNKDSLVLQVIEGLKSGKSPTKEIEVAPTQDRPTLR